MALSSGWLRKRIFSISPAEVTFARRGFATGEDKAQQRLEQIGYTFLQGYHAAILDAEPEALAQRLSEIELDLRGFAFEGAAMALALLDHLTPWRKNQLQAFLNGPGMAHIYMIHVGAGWAFARLPWLRRNIERPLARMDPLLRWLAVDGYGFHEGYFHWDRYVGGKTIPKQLSGYACRVFDQGLGRSLWFVDCADVNRVPQTIAAFPPSRHADLWSGVGLACTYAGGASRAAIEALRTAAGTYQHHLAQGAAFAAKARQRAGSLSPATALACEILCEMSADAAADVTDIALEDLTFDDADPAYEVWRQRVRARLTPSR